MPMVYVDAEQQEGLLEAMRVPPKHHVAFWNLLERLGVKTYHQDGRCVICIILWLVLSMVIFMLVIACLYIDPLMLLHSFLYFWVSVVLTLLFVLVLRLLIGNELGVELFTAIVMLTSVVVMVYFFASKVDDGEIFQVFIYGSAAIMIGSIGLIIQSQVSSRFSQRDRCVQLIPHFMLAVVITAVSVLFTVYPPKFDAWTMLGAGASMAATTILLIFVLYEVWVVKGQKQETLQEYERLANEEAKEAKAGTS